MCLIIFAHQPNTESPLLLAANRDEFYARPTSPSRFWPDHPHILAGQDDEAGGTWMGITRQGRFAAITNYRDPAASPRGKRSRGLLVSDYLNSEASPESFLQELQENIDNYADFNLLVGDNSNDLWYFTSTASGQQHIRKLPPGIYGLSNAQLDTPWPKVTLGKSRMKQLIDDAKISHDNLLETVSDPEPAKREALQKLDMTSGMDQLLSAQFICAGTYGTLSGTTLIKEYDGKVHWREQLYNEQGATYSERCYSFSVEPV